MNTDQPEVTNGQLPEWLAPPDAKCKVCGCTNESATACWEKTGRPCVWTAENLCSACAEPHAFDPHPLNPSQCAVCMQAKAYGDPICQLVQVAFDLPENLRQDAGGD